MSFTALPITVRVFKPRKSILSSPSFSMGPMASPVISSGRLGSLYSGTRSMSGSSEITTAEACTEAWRVQPSSALATAHSSVTRGSRLTCSASAGAFSSDSSSEMLSGKLGMSFAMRSASP